MGDNENAVTTQSSKPRVESDLACCDLINNLNKCCAGDADIITDSKPKESASSIKEGVSENVDMADENRTDSVTCDKASVETQDRGSDKIYQEGIDNQSFTDSSDIEVLHESYESAGDRESGTDQMRSSVSDINIPVNSSHIAAQQNMQLDETCAPRDRVSYDSDDQVTLKSDNLTYSTKVASEQSTDSEGNEVVEGDNRSSRIMSSESECDTYNVQQDESHKTITQRTLKEASRLVSDMENENSLEDAESLISDGNVSPVRPQSLSLPRPVQCKERPRRAKQGSESSSLSGYSCCSSTDALIEAAASVPLQGTVTRDGDMIAFVAEDLNSMIKMSSPISKTDDSSSASLSGKRTPRSASFGSMSSSASGWSVSASSASGWSYSAMSRSPSIVTQSPEDVPPIDPRVVDDLQVQANNVAENLRHMMSTLQNHMQKMSAVTYSCLDIYRESVDNTCNCVDSSIKSMYALMAKNEELARAMQPVNELHEQIKEINRLLDVFDLQMAREDK